MTQTDDLIDSLTKDLRPVPRHAFVRLLIVAIVPGLIVSGLVLLFGFGLRRDILHAFAMPVFWAKSVYPALLAISGFYALSRLARPDGSAGHSGWVAAMVFSLMLGLAWLQLAASAPEDHRALILGRSALFCPWLVLIFASPVLAGNVWFLRRMAPTRPMLAGFVAGLAAGAAGAWVYSWFCNENGLAFVAIWYTLGIVLTGLVGAGLGRRLPRW